MPPLNHAVTCPTLSKTKVITPLSRSVTAPVLTTKSPSSPILKSRSKAANYSRRYSSVSSFPAVPPSPPARLRSLTCLSGMQIPGASGEDNEQAGTECHDGDEATVGEKVVERKKERTVSELISATKASAAKAVSEFLKQPSPIFKRRPSLPAALSEKTDYSETAYEPPKFMSQRRVSRILETLPEQLMCVSGASSPGSGEYVAIEFRPSSALSSCSSISSGPAFPSFPSRRRMSLPQNIVTTKADQYLSYEMCDSELFSKKRRTPARRMSEPTTPSHSADPSREASRRTSRSSTKMGDRLCALFGDHRQGGDEKSTDYLSWLGLIHYHPFQAAFSYQYS